MNLVLRFSPKCEQGGRGSKKPENLRTYFMEAPLVVAIHLAPTMIPLTISSPLVEESLCLAAVVMMLFTVAYITLDRDNGDDDADNAENEETIIGGGGNAALSSGTGSIRTNKSTLTAETYLGGDGRDTALNESCECLQYLPANTQVWSERL